ncbi:MAG: glycosyltransferase family 4 protein [Elusimicrobia bacterium]|nr:glycosyltransferase family 4 protein [Elusimicrobiota bacterium]
MRIVQVLDERWDSAITEYGFSLAGALRSNSHTVIVAAWPGTYSYEEAGRRNLPRMPLRNVLSFRCALLKEKIQIVNSHTGKGHLWGWLGTRFLPIALVRTRGDARRVSRGIGHGVLYSGTEAVISASQCIAKEYQALFPALADRLKTIYPGLEASPAAPEPEGPVRVALVGRLDPVKGHSFFLDAIAGIRDRLSNERFIITGVEKNTSLAELKAKAEECGVAQWVRFEGRQPDINVFMRSCHLGVISSVGSEALSRACLEWMCAGRPVVATTVGCLPELVAHGETGYLVPPRDPQALGKHLLDLITRPDLRAQMGRKAHEIASGRFSLSRMASETERVYEAALEKRVKT